MRNGPTTWWPWVTAWMLSTPLLATPLQDHDKGIDQDLLSYGADPAAITLPLEDVVGEVELLAPKAASFVLHATLPLPKGALPPDSKTAPLVILDYDGTVAPTQTEVVTRYAKEESGAEVVELLAPVRRDPNLPPGSRLRYRVARFAHPKKPAPAAIASSLFAGQTEVPSVVQELLLYPQGILLQARDTMGHDYQLKPLDPDHYLRVERSGVARTQVRTYGTMLPIKPVPGTRGTYPHLFGIHSYLSTTHGLPIVLFDLRVNNGPSGTEADTDLDDPLGKVYFESFEISVPKGWAVLQLHEDAFLGEGESSGGRVVLPLVKKLPGKTLHVMPAQAQFHRRLAITPIAHIERARALLRSEGQAFARRGSNPVTGVPYLSWWNVGTSRYFPQKHVLPSLEHVGLDAIRKDLTHEHSALAKQLQAGVGGSYPLFENQLGWAMPYGTAYGGMTGGTDINLFQGLRTVAAASNVGLRNLQLLHRLHADRQPNALFNRFGEPTTVWHWLKGPNLWSLYVNFKFYMKSTTHPDPFGFDQADPYQIEAAVAKRRTPWYEQPLEAYDPIDLQHLVRFTRNAKALVWLANDALSKDDLWMQAELFRLSYHPFPNDKAGGLQQTGMASDLDFVDQNPGTGFPIGRGEGWGLDTMNAVYAFGDDVWRAVSRPWFDTFARLIADGQGTCNGFLQGEISGKMLGGNFRARQAIEQAIMENAVRGMVESVYRGTDPGMEAMLEDFLRDSYYSWISPLAWSPGQKGTWAITAIGPLDVSQGLYCQSLPPGGHVSWIDTFQNFSSFAYAFELTGDPVFLFRALDMAGGTELQTSLEADQLTNLHNRAALLALAQFLAGDL